MAFNFANSTLIFELSYPLALVLRDRPDKTTDYEHL